MIHMALSKPCSRNEMTTSSAGGGERGSRVFAFDASAPLPMAALWIVFASLRDRDDTTSPALAAHDVRVLSRRWLPLKEEQALISL